MLTLRASLRVAAIGIGVLALSSLSCGREVTAPGGGVSFVRRGQFSVDPQFPRLMNNASLAGVVEFERVRVVLRRADGTIALDTMVLFPVGADSVALAVDVPLGAATGASGENLKLSLGYINATGDTVFKGGPVDVTVVPQGSGATPPPVTIPVVYSGAGSSATLITVSPRAFTGYPGDRFAFTGRALDTQGAAIPNTPIIWATSDGSRVILDSNLGSAGTLAGARGTARLYAQSLTGLIDSVTLTVLSRPQRLELVSGDNQASAPTRTLTNPLVVRVVAADGLPAAGVVVTFSTAAGTLAPASATTDAAGLASTRWTVGTTVGQATMTATAAGIAGASGIVTFNAFTVVPRAMKLVFENAPSSVVAGGTLTSLRVAAQDSTGVVVSTTLGTVTLALTGGTEGARLGGAVSAALVNGVATFADLSVNRTGTGYMLTASTTGLTSAVSGAFTVTEGPATALRFTTEQGNGVAGRALAVMRVQAFDAQGNPALAFSGAVTLRLNVNPGGGTLGGTLTRTAVAGVATFDDVILTRSGSGYTLAATADGLTTGGTIPFDITSGAAGRLLVVRGAGQSAPAGSVLDTIIVSVTDTLGNPIAGAGVSAAAAAGNGSVTVLTAVTDAIGLARLRWILGPTAGGQQITVGASALSALVTATAVGSAGPTKLFLGFDNLNITSGVPTALSVFLTVPQAAPVTVSLTTLDTLSQWTTSSVVIPAGATSASATILGRAPGASRAVATTAGAGADTLNLSITQATIRLYASYIDLHTSHDTLETRVELSAPAPAGGVTVSFDLSTAGIVNIVPSSGTRVTNGSGGCDLRAEEEAATAAGSRRTANALSGTTVTIKAGETQAYIYVISDSLEGSTNITPIAVGYGSQTANVYVSSQSLYASGSFVLTPGSYVNASVGRSSSRQVSQAVTLVARTPGVVQVPAVVVIRADAWGQAFKMIGTAIDSTWVVASAPGFASESMFVSVRRPALVISATGWATQVPVGNLAQQAIEVYSRDSTRNYAGFRATPLTVTVTSRNPAVATVTDATLTIESGLFYALTRLVPVSSGSTYLVFSASGYLSDSVYVNTGGGDSFASWNGMYTVGAGQYVSAYLTTVYGNIFPVARNFSLTSSDAAVAVVDSTVLLRPGNSYSESFRVVGVAPGYALIAWSAPGFYSSASSMTVTTPNLGHTNPSCCLTAGGGARYFTVVARDSINQAHEVIADLAVTITSTNINVVEPTSSTVTISRGSYYATAYAVPKAAGSASFIMTAPGYRPDTLALTVSSAGASRISISDAFFSVGKRQVTSFVVNRSGDMPATRVSIARRGSATAISDTAFDVGAGNPYPGELRISGLNFGTDTLIFTAPGHISDTVLVRVTTPRFYVYTNAGTVLQNYPYGYVQVQLTDSLGFAHAPMDTVRFTVTPSDSGVMRTPSSNWVIAPNSSYFSSTVQFRGPGTARFRLQDAGGLYPADSTPLVTVQQPELHFSQYWEPLFVGMRQRAADDEMYIYTDYEVLVPTWIRLQRSTSALVTTPDSVLIPANSYYAYFSLAGRDTVGGLQIQASAPGFASATKDITVSRPGFSTYVGNHSTVQSDASVEVQAMETGGNYARTVTEDVPVTLTSDAPSVANVAPSTVTIPAGSGYTNAAQLVISNLGKVNITASDARGIYQHYLSGTDEGTIFQADFYPIIDTWRLGVGQRLPFNVEFNFSPEVDVPVTFTGTGGHTSRTGTTVETVPAYTNDLNSTIEGTSAGSDTLVISSPGFRNGRRIVEVSQGTLVVSSMPISMKVGDVANLSVYLRTSDNRSVQSSGSTTFALAATNAAWWNGASSITSIVAADGVQSVSTAIKATTAGTATLTISSPNYLTKSFTVQVLP